MLMPYLQNDNAGKVINHQGTKVFTVVGKDEIEGRRVIHEFSPTSCRVAHSRKLLHSDRLRLAAAE